MIAKTFFNLQRFTNSITNITENNRVKGSSGKDLIFNYATNVTIQAGAGDDSIHTDVTIGGSENFKNVTVFGDAGNDTIYSNDPFVSLNGGSGNDYIYHGNYSEISKVTIQGGKGDDTIVSSHGSDIFQYSYGDGNDTIIGFDSEDTLRIVSQTDYSVSNSGNGCFIKFDDSNSIFFAEVTSTELENMNVIVNNNSVHIEDNKNYVLSNGTQILIPTGEEKEKINQQSLTYLDNILNRPISDTGSEALTSIGSITKLLGEFKGFEEFSIVADICDIVKSVITLTKPENWYNDTTRLAEATNLNSKLFSLVDDLLNLSDDSVAKPVGIGFAASLLALFSSYISTRDGVTDEEKDKITECWLNVLEEASKVLAPESMTKPFGTISLVSAVGSSLLMGSIQFQKSLDEYSSDGYASLRDKIYATIDGTTTSLYTFTHKMTHGVDDIFFGWLDEVTGGDRYNGMTYAQKAAEGYKILFNYIENKSVEIASNKVKDAISSLFGKFAVSSSGTSSENSDEIFYSYIGGKKSISDYAQGEKIELRSDFTGISFSGNDFILNSRSGELTIKNVRDKLIDVAVNNNSVGYAYMASGAGKLDGSGFSQLEVIIGGDNAANEIIAGSGGSSLWGGAGGNDILIGGSGQDNFFYGKYDGTDIIKNASSGDVINLYDVTLSDITAAVVSGNKISATFDTGNHLNIESSENLSPTFQLADGSQWKFNQSSGQWQND